MTNISRCKVRMYRAGTGDCFILKYYAGTKRQFTMMIDGGVWEGSQEYLTPFVENIKATTGGKIDLLVITHEHQDHVLMFERCKEIFKEIEIEELWFGWTEDDSDKKVVEWKKNYGDKKMALNLASEKLEQLISNKNMKTSLFGNFNEEEMLAARTKFSNVLTGFSELHVSKKEANKTYKGSLKGMHVIKNDLKVKKIRYCRQGEIIKNLANLPGVKFYILGPPNIYAQVKKEGGKEEEGYDHNKDLDENELFALSILREPAQQLPDALLPFDRSTIDISKSAAAIYNEPSQAWRKIEYEWLFSAGNLGLRMNSLTNNLSLAFAIEFVGSKKVMLFPGDAEIGSWESWHKIKWPESGENNKHLTEDLLNRTVFYKVAHHLSHNGTARSIGLEMMEHEDLAAMATLDFSNISTGWKNTMPNRAIVQELLKRTKGRLIVLNEEEIFYDFNGQITLKTKIEEAKDTLTAEEKKEFLKNLIIPKAKTITYKKAATNITEEKILYYEYTVSGI